MRLILFQKWPCIDGIPPGTSELAPGPRQDDRTGPPHSEGPHLQDGEQGAGLLVARHAGSVDVSQF